MLSVIGRQFRIRRLNRGRKVRRSYEHVFDLNFFVPTSVFSLYFRGANSDGVGDQLAKPFLQLLIPQKVLKFWNGHAGTGLDLGGVTVFQPSVAVPGSWEYLLNSIREFLVGDADAEPLRFHGERLLDNPLIQYLFGIHRFVNVRERLPVQRGIQLALHVRGSDALPAYGGDGVGTIGKSSAAHAGNQV